MISLCYLCQRMISGIALSGVGALHYPFPKHQSGSQNGNPALAKDLGMRLLVSSRLTGWCLLLEVLPAMYARMLFSSKGV